MPAHIGGRPRPLRQGGDRVPDNHPAQSALYLRLVVLHDAQTGTPLAVMDAGYLTAVRTGASAAWRPGSRAQERPHGGRGSAPRAGGDAAGSVCAVRNIKAARVFDTERKPRAHVCRRVEPALDIEVLPVNHPREAIVGVRHRRCRDERVNARLRWDWLEPGQHVNAVGSHAPQARARHDAWSGRRSSPISGSLLVEAGDLMIPIQEGAITREHVRAGLGEGRGGSQARARVRRGDHAVQVGSASRCRTPPSPALSTGRHARPRSAPSSRSERAGQASPLASDAEGATASASTSSSAHRDRAAARLLHLQDGQEPLAVPRRHEEDSAPLAKGTSKGLVGRRVPVVCLRP